MSEGGSRYAVSEGNGAGNRADSLGSRAGGGNGNGAGEHGQDLSWALITPDVMNSIYTAILRGMCDIGHRHGIGVQIFNTDNDVPRQHGIIRRLVEGRCDGVVLVPAIDRGGQEDACRLLIESRVPLVFCNRRVEGIREAPLVCSNGYYGGYLATRHLLEMGYRKPAFFDMKTYSVSLERYYGYVAAVMEAGLPLDSRRVVLNGDFGAERHGYGEVAAMLRLADPPDSVFCAGEMFDMPLLDGVYRAVADAGLKISGDVGVISHDNSALCLRQIPNTTAVSYPAYESGLRAAEMLYGLMGGAPPPDGGLCILHPELVVRESCLGPQ
ncbi:MAG: substrate-binding domain-containing protein [Clostridiales bacterium]|nr:substrate-binding domain-containing protein [Clostridiales bacterium]